MKRERETDIQIKRERQRENEHSSFYFSLSPLPSLHPSFPYSHGTHETDCQMRRSDVVAGYWRRRPDTSEDSDRYARGHVDVNICYLRGRVKVFNLIYPCVNLPFLRALQDGRCSHKRFNSCRYDGVCLEINSNKTCAVYMISKSRHIEIVNVEVSNFSLT